jgi:hypothetical protein
VTVLRSPHERMDGIGVDVVAAAIAPLLTKDRR